jgi:GTP-binding protein YchF
MGFKCGIVGLPNVGKSTIFNALTNGKAASANFPFCTIEPNTGTVPVPDPRLNELATIAKSEKIIPTKISFVDIAGLIKGAAEGEGLGNQFLGHIRSVDAIIHVVRCFEDSDIIHVEDSVDPARDADIILAELILADYDSVQKQIEKQAKKAKSGKAEDKVRHQLLQGLSDHLGKLLPARSFVEVGGIEDVMDTLLTSKPMLLLANLSEEQISSDHSTIPEVKQLETFAAQHNARVLCISGKLEAELAELEADERKEYMEDLGISLTGLESLIIEGYRLLNLITFFTAGPKEARAWTAAEGSSAPVCAGKIHSDFEKNFIRAEVIAYSDYLTFKGELGAREAGKMRVEGREYIAQDGDVMHFRVGK